MRTNQAPPIGISAATPYCSTSISPARYASQTLAAESNNPSSGGMSAGSKDQPSSGPICASTHTQRVPSHTSAMTWSWWYLGAWDSGEK